MRKVLFFLFVINFLPNAKGQKKIEVDITAQANLSFTNDKFKTFYSAENRIELHYLSRKKNTNPFFYLTCNPKLSINNKLDIGLQTGIQFHYNEIGFLAETRTFVAIPLQATADLKIKILKGQTTGLSVAAGGLFYKIDDDVNKITNALLFNASVFYQINKKQRIKFGVEKQIDNTSFHFNIYNPNSNEVFKYPLKRLSLFLGYTFMLR